MVFKGDREESAVLCTENKTYDVKEAETSNSILLLPELTFPDEESSNAELVNRKVFYYSNKDYNVLIMNIYKFRLLVCFIPTMK